MSQKESQRPGLLRLAECGKITNTEGASAAGVSVRQFRRWRKSFRAEGGGRRPSSDGSRSASRPGHIRWWRRPPPAARPARAKAASTSSHRRCWDRAGRSVQYSAPTIRPSAGGFNMDDCKSCLGLKKCPASAGSQGARAAPAAAALSLPPLCSAASYDRTRDQSRDWHASGVFEPC